MSAFGDYRWHLVLFSDCQESVADINWLLGNIFWYSVVYFGFLWSVVAFSGIQLRSMVFLVQKWPYLGNR